MNELNLSKKQVITGIITVILLIGIAVGVYLVQIQQVFKSKASIPGIEVKTTGGAGVSCDEQSTECVTDSPEDVTVTVNKQYFEELEAPTP